MESHPESFAENFSFWAPRPSSTKQGNTALRSEPSIVENPIAVATDLVKVYGSGTTQVTALDRINVKIPRQELTAIMGPSGSGKSTLMHCLAGLDSITSGTITLNKTVISSLSPRKLTKLRRNQIGFIFQSFNLIPTLTAQENITLPADIAHRKLDKQRLKTIIDAIGLTERLQHRPAELSGGQQQRVACARALVGDPEIIFADEPTGNLDSEASYQILKFLRHAVDTLKQSVVLVTHDPDSAAWADRVLFLVDGQLVAELRKPTRKTILEALDTMGTWKQAGITTERSLPAPETKLPPPGQPATEVAVEVAEETNLNPPPPSDPATSQVSALRSLVEVEETGAPPSDSEILPALPSRPDYPFSSDDLKPARDLTELDPELTALVKQAEKLFSENPPTIFETEFSVPPSALLQLDPESEGSPEGSPKGGSETD